NLNLLLNPNLKMHYVYILRSIRFPDQIYVGYTTNLESRLSKHNSGQSEHTSRYLPWEIIWYGAFPEKLKALAFENYLKSHSGNAFASIRLM
ncbi:MAG: GIY-YIG nuclease family protein, partial [Opitutales bacterium]|nr:GIY-YIG nuclease family protein [Opitutales bacterium]